MSCFIISWACSIPHKKCWLSLGLTRLVPIYNFWRHTLFCLLKVKSLIFATTLLYYIIINTTWPIIVCLYICMCVTPNIWTKISIVRYWKWPLRPLRKFIGLYKTADHGLAIQRRHLIYRTPSAAILPENSTSLPGSLPLGLVMKDLDSAKHYHQGCKEWEKPVLDDNSSGNLTQCRPSIIKRVWQFS